ncbi:hypothetical protein SLEP1_g4822 [Rubroshorea leprosula]|uniref:Transmembrane protein n=1 Tax=Rubroshorea leprosula TaxID=152421 RepID=A0AAV5HPZ2_9ROSI|nr:hypothetical protein SLEP1_g4822 [Rubroshorea leprosula]
MNRIEIVAIKWSLLATLVFGAQFPLFGAASSCCARLGGMWCITLWIGLAIVGWTRDAERHILKLKRTLKSVLKGVSSRKGDEEEEEEEEEKKMGRRNFNFRRSQHFHKHCLSTSLFF